MSLLFPSIAFLFIAPALHTFSIKKDYFYSSLNGFVFVIIAALVGVEILPELIGTEGPEVTIMLLLGLALPFISEKMLHRTRVVHKVAVLVGVFGLIIHILADGTALAMESVDANLALSVALHRVPIGLFVWWFIRPHFGSIVAYVMLSLIAVGTLLGFHFSDSILSPLQTSTVAYFQAFVVGTLIHVLFHKPPSRHICSSRKKINQRAEGVGNIIGLICAIYLLANSDTHSAETSWLSEMGETLTYLALETAPMLLIAFLFAGVIKAFMPDSFVSWLTRGRSFNQATKGMAVGIPLPLCSCSVVPVYQSLINKGVPQSAAIAFLIATPELGIDAILISLPLLGAEMTVTRLVGAALLAVIVALLVSKFSNGENKVSHSHDSESEAGQTFTQKLKSGMHYSTHDLLDHIAPWILVGIIIAAFIQPFLGQLQLAAIPGGLQVILFAILGIPVYVCASSATPLVAIFLMNGVSPGAGLAFLLAGPATNISTFGVLAKLHNQSTATILAISCLVTSIGLGLATNFVLPDFQPTSFVDDEHHFNWIHWSALIVLMALFAYSVLRRGLRAFILELIPHQHSNHGSCSHSNCEHHHH
ncbi:hypothetical protein EYS14_06925 [Alteromonadaceae bacterium M269]|nr:hypothetical protein EYS14_06925 [Alteromonadaceae bacterium M269]